MIYKQYGKTGMQVSAVGFGGMRFDLTRSKEENAELLHYASSLGINYFDTAPDYCDEQSEDIFGIAFKDMPAPFYVSTKAMPVYYDTADKAREIAGEIADAHGRRIRSTFSMSGACARWSIMRLPCAKAGSMRGCCKRRRMG